MLTQSFPLGLERTKNPAFSEDFLLPKRDDETHGSSPELTGHDLVDLGPVWN